MNGLPERPANHVVLTNCSSYGSAIGLLATDIDTLVIEDSEFLQAKTGIKLLNVGDVTATRVRHTEQDAGFKLSALSEMIRRIGRGYV